MSAPGIEWAVTNLGNASVLIQVGDAVVLTDPFFGRSRGISDAAALTPDEMPRLTAIIGSHWAQDHWEIDLLANYPHRDTTAVYVADWARVGLAEALAAARTDDVRRGVSTVGPHRDDVDLRIAGLPARTHASQGEQRSLALALRLAAHHVITDVTGSAPILLLDDVFSELDPDRSDALLANLPAGQTVLTSASGLPPKASPELILHIADHTISPG